MSISAEYNLSLVLLSLLIAIISSYSSLNLVNRLSQSKGYVRMLWVLAGAFSLGFGIWSMHFIAMLAMHFSVDVKYDIFLVVLSILAAILACGLAFFIVSKGWNNFVHRLVGSILIGTGIVSMHYIGMHAMQMDAIISYHPLLFLLSIIIAIVASWAAIFLLSRFQNQSGMRHFSGEMLGSSLVMAAAIAGMHYTGMAAATFKVDHKNIIQHELGRSIDNHIMAYFVGIGMFVILGIVVTSVFLDRKFEMKSSQLEFIDNIYQALILTANDAIILTDSTGRIMSWNKSAQRIFGYKESEALGKRLRTIASDSREIHELGMEGYIAEKASEILGRTIEIQGVRKDGEIFPAELSFTTLQKDDDVFYSATIRDISERKHSEKQIIELIYRDPLTNLPNRRMLNDHLTMCIEQAALNHQTVAVMFIDLDRFKYINDTLGHGIGDRFLIEAAERMNTCLEKKDMLARQGGDEYIVVLPNTTQGKTARIAESLLKQLSEPFQYGETEFYISGSIGISLYPNDGDVAEELIKNADTSMYRAKEIGKNNYQFFTADMNDQMAKRMMLELGLRRAIANQEFELYFQPQIDVPTGKIIGVEALIRWNHPEYGLVPPNEFIPLAEETGLILPMGRWIIEEACSRAKSWVDRGISSIRVSVNISAHQFQQANFVSHIRYVLEETELEPRLLELEITESVVQDPDYAIPVMKQLKEMGVKLSLDDFGTGYSSLSYLRLFPLDTLKIDKSFIDTINEEFKDQAIVRTIINMAKSLNLNVIAEGVETTEQLTFLAEESCDEYQGYLFSRPLPVKEIEKMMGL